MTNSRLKLMALADDEKPTNSSRGKGLILETPYRPGFVDDKDLETVKMALDKELSEISNAFYQTTERTADTITRVDRIEIGTDGIGAKIEEVDKVSKERDEALASRITTLSATVDNNTSSIVTESEARATADEVMTKRIDTILGSMEGDLGPLVGQFQEQIRVLGEQDGILAERITTLDAEYKTADGDIRASVSAEESARVSADQALASSISTVKSELDGEIASVKQFAETEVSKLDGEVDKINAKWGVELDVNGKISGVVMNNNGARSNFEVRADVFRFTDTSGGTSGGFVSSGGITHFNGALSAATGSFAGDISAATGTFTGGIRIQDQGGNVGMKISNNQILVYDEHGRLRMRMGWLG